MCKAIATQPLSGAERQQFIVIGLDDNPSQYFPPEIIRLIQESSTFSGGLRHREIVSSLLPQGYEWIDITVPLDNVFAKYEVYRQIIVFASGDPLFFGFANTIRRRLPDAIIRLFPAFNSLQTLAHRLVMPYDDMHTVSLTGRPWHEFDKALIECRSKIGVLTDREHTPSAIAQRMLAYGYSQYIMYTGEHLGNMEKECIRRLTLAEAANSTFTHPNNLILLAEGQSRHRLFFGIPDNRFALLDGRTKMITKAPVRLLTLSALGLHDRNSFWDIGFCTGSVSIEAKLQFPHLHITAFEIRNEGRELMETNSRRFGTPGITTVIGDFLFTGLDAFPRPDAIFIGGHGGHLKEILARARNVLRPGGIIVFNSVSGESRQLFLEGAREAGLTVLPGMHISIDDFNPIEILKATL